uniref:cytochrome P450 2U1-like n=1 Tax=Ciona intestinalis TaxID=7719 RepID=UPI000EF47E1A|nr:cytochrome P450 2U1-like [Ciona intestinalis]|eukprot:XP_026691500.1 cytochrome P450 2U1-like [Ciona intestinalis]
MKTINLSNKMLYGKLYFKETELRHCLVDFFIAGTETSTNAILWSLLALIHYPNIQEEIHQELIDNIGEQVVPSIDHRDKLPLFRAFVQEIFRFKTLLPLSIQHRASHDVEIGGYVIPKGTKVVGFDLKQYEVNECNLLYPRVPGK